MNSESIIAPRYFRFISNNTNKKNTYKFGDSTLFKDFDILSKYEKVTILNKIKKENKWNTTDTVLVKLVGKTYGIFVCNKFNICDAKNASKFSHDKEDVVDSDSDSDLDRYKKVKKETKKEDEDLDIYKKAKKEVRKQAKKEGKKEDSDLDKDKKANKTLVTIKYSKKTTGLNFQEEIICKNIMIDYLDKESIATIIAVALK